MCCNYRVMPSEQPQKNTSNTELIQCLVVRFVDDHPSRSNLHGLELILCVRVTHEGLGFALIYTSHTAMGGV